LHINNLSLAVQHKSTDRYLFADNTVDDISGLHRVRLGDRNNRDGDLSFLWRISAPSRVFEVGAPLPPGGTMLLQHVRTGLMLDVTTLGVAAAPSHSGFFASATAPQAAVVLTDNARHLRVRVWAHVSVPDILEVRSVHYSLS
jgi:hypothetical protein